jgi:hypothetical protein
MSLSDQQIIVGLVIVMALWYVIGTWYNRRRGIRTLTWLRDGLRSLGGQLEMSWIGSAASGARAMVTKADAPFRQLDAVFLLESRELLPLWLANRLRGKRDELIIKASLRSHLKGELEIVQAGSRLERGLRKEEQSPWQWEPGPHGLSIACRGTQGSALRAAAEPFLRAYGLYLHRFSWRRDKPDLLLHARLAGLTDHVPADFFNELGRVFAHAKAGKEATDV